MIYHIFKIHFHFTLKVVRDPVISTTYMHLPIAWWALTVVVAPCQWSWLYTVIFNIVKAETMYTTSTQWSGADIYIYICLRSFLRGMRYQLSFSISLHISPALYILSSSLTVSFSNTFVIHIGLDIHFWQGEAWSHSQSLAAVLRTWIKLVSCCDGCLSHRSIPSLLTWYDGRWYSTTAHWVQMLARASSVRRPWQTTLYSFNPKVLKQHLTQIEVDFVIAGEKKKMTDGKYEKES